MRLPYSIALVGLLAACTAAPPPPAVPSPVTWQRIDGKQVDLTHLRQTRAFCEGEAARANPPSAVVQQRYQPGITLMGDALADIRYAKEVREAQERTDYERQVARERLSVDCMAQQGYGPLY